MKAGNVLILPGWQDSGERHWQSIWTHRHGYTRVDQHEWMKPLRGDWLARLEEVVLSCDEPAVLVAHSLGCILAAAWSAHSLNAHKVKAALLVAPGDVERPDMRELLPGWSPIELQALRFPSVLVASRNDPYCEFVRARMFASAWGSQFTDHVPDWQAGQKAMCSVTPDISTPIAARLYERLNTMVTKKPKGLGRGLEALLGPAASEATPEPTAPNPGLPASLLLADMVPGQYQPRTRMDEGALYELAESIKSQGIMQPILVRKLANGSNAGKYEIIAGERRYRAAKLAGLDSVPVLVREVPDEAAAAMALIENIQREDLNPLEEAQGLQRLVREFGLTHEQAAQAVGRSRSAASNLLRLLNLADPVQGMLMAGDIDMGHARALLALERATQITAANQIAAKKLSVRETESLVKRLGSDGASRSSKPKEEKTRDVRRLEEELSDLLTAEVEVRVKKRAKRNGRVEEMGELAIQFASLDELNGLIDRLRGPIQ